MEPASMTVRKDSYYGLQGIPSRLKRREYKALSAMDEFIDRDRWVMNYPYGNYSDAVTEHIKSRGAVLGLSTKVGVANAAADDRFAIPRFDCNDFPPKSDNYTKY